MGEGRGRVEDEKQKTKKRRNPITPSLRRFPPVIKQLAKKI